MQHKRTITTRNFDISNHERKFSLQSTKNPTYVIRSIKNMHTNHAFNVGHGFRQNKPKLFLRKLFRHFFIANNAKKIHSYDVMMLCSFNKMNVIG